MSGGGGEARLEFLDDVQRSTNVKVNGKFLKFDSSVGKFVGDDGFGGNTTTLNEWYNCHQL